MGGVVPSPPFADRLGEPVRQGRPHQQGERDAEVGLAQGVAAPVAGRLVGVGVARRGGGEQRRAEIGRRDLGLAGVAEGAGEAAGEPAGDPDHRIGLGEGQGHRVGPGAGGLGAGGAGGGAAPDDGQRARRRSRPGRPPGRPRRPASVPDDDDGKPSPPAGRRPASARATAAPSASGPTAGVCQPPGVGSPARFVSGVTSRPAGTRTPANPVGPAPAAGPLGVDAGTGELAPSPSPSTTRQPAGDGRSGAGGRCPRARRGADQVQGQRGRLADAVGGDLLVIERQRPEQPGDRAPASDPSAVDLQVYRRPAPARRSTGSARSGRRRRGSLARRRPRCGRRSSRRRSGSAARRRRGRCHEALVDRLAGGRSWSVPRDRRGPA